MSDIEKRLATPTDSRGRVVSIFVGAMTVFYGIATVTMLSFFVGAPWFGFEILGAALIHAMVNVVAAGPMIALVERVLAQFSDEEVGRRSPMPLGFDRRGLERRRSERGGAR